METQTLKVYTLSELSEKLKHQQEPVIRVSDILPMAIDIVGTKPWRGWIETHFELAFTMGAMLAQEIGGTFKVAQENGGRVELETLCRQLTDEFQEMFKGIIFGEDMDYWEEIDKFMDEKNEIPVASGSIIPDMESILAKKQEYNSLEQEINQKNMEMSNKRSKTMLLDWEKLKPDMKTLGLMIGITEDGYNITHPDMDYPNSIQVRYQLNSESVVVPQGFSQLYRYTDFFLSCRETQYQHSGESFDSLEKMINSPWFNKTITKLVGKSY